MILAGGLGTRMRAQLGATPKSLIEVGGRPFVHWQLDLLATQGIQCAILALGHGASQIAQELSGATPPGMNVVAVDEGEKRRGTGGALRLVVDTLPELAEHFFVTYGDSYLPIDFGPVACAHKASSRPVLMTLFRNENRHGASNVRWDCAQNLLYEKRDHRRSEFAWIDFGLLIISRDWVVHNIPSGAEIDLAPCLHAASLRGEIAGHAVQKRFFEVGSPDGWRNLDAHLRATQRCK